VQQECTENSLQIEIINHVINVIKKLIATADKGKLPQVGKKHETHIQRVPTFKKTEICFVFFFKGVSDDAGESCRTNHT